MRAVLKATVFAIFFVGMASSLTLAWEKDEHRQIAEKALAAVLAECRADIQEMFMNPSAENRSLRSGKALWGGKTFGEISSLASGKDVSRSRFHERGRTIAQQLAPLSASLIEAVWNECTGKNLSNNLTRTAPWASLFSVELPKHNVVANYLVHHITALRFAQIAGQEKERGETALRLALVYEAAAQSYLTDAFSSGHMFVSLNDAFSRLHPINNREGHDFFRNEGAYVLNSRGDVWQTFGDKLLFWYAPTYRHVLEACVTSLREIFLVFSVTRNTGTVPAGLKEWALSSSQGVSLEEMVRNWTVIQDGEKYYSEVRMPTLLLLPVPISATWSMRSDQVDEHGIRRRKHYPQLRERGLHDPDLEGIDLDFIYPREAVPEWMVPDFLTDKAPADVVKSHPDIASVRYIQPRDFPPSYKGTLFHLGGGTVFDRMGSGFGSMAGLGYGLNDELFLFNKVSFDLKVMPSLDEGRRLLISPQFGFGLILPAPFKLWKAYRFEIGYAFGLQSPYEENGWNFAFGIESPTIPLGFTYSGLTLRLQYRIFYLERRIQGLFFELVLH
jgi:hypothetical protein